MRNGTKLARPSFAHAAHDDAEARALALEYGERCTGVLSFTFSLCPA
jgi:hypothetical protein